MNLSFNIFRLIIVCLVLVLCTHGYAQQGITKIIEGNISDAQYKLPVDAKITYYLLPDENIYGTFENSLTTGDYKAFVPLEGTYKIVIEAKGYENTYDTLEIVSDTIVRLDVKLNPQGVGQIIHTKNLEFAQDSHKILEQSFEELDGIAKMLVENPERIIRLEGHTDYGSNEKSNMELSEKRIKSVKNYLVKKGVDPDRIQLQAHGSSKPIVRSHDPELRAANRRVDIVILKR